MSDFEDDILMSSDLEQNSVTLEISSVMDNPEHLHRADSYVTGLAGKSVEQLQSRDVPLLPKRALNSHA